MKKVVSFCLFGNKKLYCQGMIENLKEMKEIYPGWIARIYYSDDVPIEYIEEAKNYNPELIKKERKSGFDGTLWRFLPLLDKNVEVWVSRDCDSRINYRESEAVTEWLESDKSVHIMRDSIHHNQVIQAGMFGINNRLFNTKYKVDLFNQNQNFNDRNSDQIILFNVIWPKILNDHFAHDIQGTRPLQFGNPPKYKKWKTSGSIIKNFPDHKTLKYGIFVGQTILEDNSIKRYKHVEEEYKSRNVPY